MNIPELYELFKKYPLITTDSRKDVSNSIFFAIKGENFNGNKFAMQAIENGAAFVVADESCLEKNNQIIIVENSLLTLQQLAEYHRDTLSIPVIAITGSNGKTTSKELISKVLEKKYNLFSTPGNLNNHIGVPLSILMIKEEHQVAVLELGANHTGENQFLLNLSKPNFGVLTNIGKDHLGEFGGEQGVIAAYKEVIDYFNSNPDFNFIHNIDDPEISRFIKRDNCIKISQKYLISDIFGQITDFFPTINIEINDQKLSIKSEIKTHLFGSFNLYNVLTAYAVGIKLNVEIKSIQAGIEEYYPTNNRSQVINWNGNTIIFDAYNANPSSMELAIQDFSKINHNNKILVLGDMHELDEYAPKEHEKILYLARKLGFNKVFLIGNQFGELKIDSNFLWFTDVFSFKLFLNENPFVNSLVLVKGSRSEKLEAAFPEAFYHL